MQRSVQSLMVDYGDVSANYSLARQLWTTSSLIAGFETAGLMEKGWGWKMVWRCFCSSVSTELLWWSSYRGLVYYVGLSP